MIEIAVKNGISRNNYHGRISIGWSEIDAATRPLKKHYRNSEYALYKGDDFIAMGTIDELAELRGVQRETILFYMTPAYQSRLDRLDKGNRIRVLKV